VEFGITRRAPLPFFNGDVAGNVVTLPLSDKIVVPARPPAVEKRIILRAIKFVLATKCLNEFGI
tara:strand:+ start:4042 stop:4233 length:192 start_codon:yes stop_codon:yes gene_type:complete